jgi:hypothetical protein
MAITKIIKNKSGETRNILNCQVAHNDEYEVSSNLWLKLYEHEFIKSEVENGNYVVNNGTSDLSAALGLKLLAQFQPYEGVGWEKRRLLFQVHKTKNGNNLMSNAQWFDMWSGSTSSGSYSGFGSSTQPFIMPCNSKLTKAVVVFRKANFDWISTSGNIFCCIGFYDHLYNGTDLICKLNMELVGSFFGNNTGYDTFKFEITDFDEAEGTNYFSALSILGVQLRKDISQAGQIQSLSDPILLLEFEEV